MLSLPLRSTLFPYTTLFRSELVVDILVDLERRVELGEARIHVHGLVHGGHTEGAAALGLALRPGRALDTGADRSEEHTSELQSPCNLVCRLLLERKNIRSSVTLDKSLMGIRNCPSDEARNNDFMYSFDKSC